jgi:hypothetical protein
MMSETAERLSLSDDVPSTHDLFEETVREHPTLPPPAHAPVDEVALAGGSIFDDDEALLTTPPPPPPSSRPSTAPVEVPVEAEPPPRVDSPPSLEPEGHSMRRVGTIGLLAFVIGIGATLGAIQWLSAGPQPNQAVAAPAPVAEVAPPPAAVPAPAGDVASDDEGVPLASYYYDEALLMSEPAASTPFDEEDRQPAVEDEPDTDEARATERGVERSSERSAERQEDRKPDEAAPEEEDEPVGSEDPDPETAAAAPEPSVEAVPSFDVNAARAAVAAAARVAAGCGDGVHKGSAPVAITFAPTGRVTTAVVQGGPLLGTPVASCVAQSMRSASVPPHSDGYVTVSRTVQIR